MQQGEVICDLYTSLIPIDLKIQDAVVYSRKATIVHVFSQIRQNQQGLNSYLVQK